MARIEMLEVQLHGERIGTLSKMGEIVRFSAEDAFICDPHRPTLSLSYAVPGAAQHKFLDRDYVGNVATGGQLPPFFSNLVPEAPGLRRYIAARRGCSPADDFALLAATGADLPGALTVAPLNAPDEPLLRRHTPFPKAASILPVERALDSCGSLAGAQLKAAMSAVENNRRLTMQMVLDGAPVIVKFHDPSRPELVRSEHLAMELARAAGANVARTQLVSMKDVAFEDDRFAQMVAHLNEPALVVQRFDRGTRQMDPRVHTEDFCQIQAKRPSEKYAPDVTGLYYMKALGKIGAGGALEAEEVLRRTVINVLLGNCDAHRKNWSVIYPDRCTPTLSPAYDVVPVSFFREHADFSIEREYQALTRERLVSAATQSGMDRTRANEIIDQALDAAHSLWPRLVADLPAPKQFAEWLSERGDALPIAQSSSPCASSRLSF